MAAEHTIEWKMINLSTYQTKYWKDAFHHGEIVNILGELKYSDSPFVNCAMLLGNTSVAWH